MILFMPLSPTICCHELVCHRNLLPDMFSCVPDSTVHVVATSLYVIHMAATLLHLVHAQDHAD